LFIVGDTEKPVTDDSLTLTKLCLMTLMTA